MSETPLEFVRRFTHDSHQRVEDLTRELGVLQSENTFTRHLQLLWQHHQRELQRVSTHPAPTACVQQRVEELAHDIVALGARVPQALAPTDDHFSLPEALGSTYVIEGSRLGAFAIAKSLAKNGVPTHGLLSVGGDLATIRARFQTTAAHINALTPSEGQVMASAAKRSFDALLAAYADWLNEKRSA